MTMMPALVFGPAGAGPGIGTYLVGYGSLSNGGPGADEFLQVIRVDNPLGVPTFTGEFVNIGDLENVGGVYGFPPLPRAPQSGTGTLIETNDSRALDAVWRNNSLWVTATINPNNTNDPVNTGQATAHWFRLNTSAVPAPIVVADQGNIGGEDVAPGAFTFFPSVAVNMNGDAKFGFAASAASIYCGAYFAGREAADPPGTVQPTATVQAGLDYYQRTFGGPRNRWSDYSGAAVDPIDDTTFWIFNEYAEYRGTGFPPEDGRWGTAWKSCMVQGVPVAWDFGDAPDGPGPPFTYPTLLANNGARHGIVAGVYMGTTIDSEPDGQPSPGTVGDDNAGVDDEDGVTLSGNGFTLVAGEGAQVVVTVSANGWLDAWFDYNHNGSWLDAGELVYDGPVSAGGNVINFTVAAAAEGGTTYARFRYNLNGPLPPSGAALNGEVEDYNYFTEVLDFGDAPDALGYRTLRANNGARSVIGSTYYMGNLVDKDLDGQPHPNALGDDQSGVDDEDGVTFTTPLDPTQSASVDVLASNNGYVDAWIDFDSDGDWSPAEHVISAPAVVGVNTYNFTVPATSANAYSTFARFRFNSGGPTAPWGYVQSYGEVEDYKVQILKDTVTGAKDRTPDHFALFDPMPNPFNPITTLSFALPTASHVVLEVYDVRGQLVATILDENRAAGVHNVTWNGRDRAGQPVASGVYLCRIKAGSFSDTKRMVLLK